MGERNEMPAELKENSSDNRNKISLFLLSSQLSPKREKRKLLLSAGGIFI